MSTEAMSKVGLPDTLPDDDATALRHALFSAGAAGALREANAFLREQLEHKRHWYETALEAERARSANLAKELDEALCECDELRVAVAELVQEVRFHNSDAENEGGYSTNAAWLNERALLTAHEDGE